MEKTIQEIYDDGFMLGYDRCLLSCPYEEDEAMAWIAGFEDGANERKRLDSFLLSIRNF